MAEPTSTSRRKTLGRSASTESTDYSVTMGRSVRRKKPKERWLLTRKTWRYMTDAGRKLIPDGAQNTKEDLPKIESYFQEVCKKEPKFLLWRKNSYPGARKKRKPPRKGGSCRKACSADEVDILKPERPTNLALLPTTSGKFDLKKMKEDFLNTPATPTNYSGCSFEKLAAVSGSTDSLNEDPDAKQLANMLEQYLRLETKEEPTAKQSTDINYQELFEKLQRHLRHASQHFGHHSGISPTYVPQHQVHFQGDYVHRTLSDTLSRYFGQSPNRDKVISDLLTDRKALEKLYFELRKTKGFRGSRGGTGYTTSFAYGPQKSNYENTNKTSSPREGISRVPTPVHPPPLIEIQSETIDVTYKSGGTQTVPIPEYVLNECEREYKKQLAEEEEERKEKEPSKASRRRSSVDHDDVSQSVSETIKRYLRMARKKSVDTDKGLKRVNYDRNLRFIRPKGEITKPGDDDGLNKGCQTNDDWILTYRDLKFDDVYDVSDAESRFSSSRSSIDEGAKSSPSSPPPRGGHSFLSHLLHGRHDKQDKMPLGTGAAAAMQKSKSSSSVVHQGSRLVAKKIFRSRSKSQTRPSQAPCSWTPQGSCVWNSVTGRQVILNDTNLLHLTEIERKVLKKVAIAKLQALNLGVSIKAPIDEIGSAVTKPKRRPYLLKRKALTTGIFDANKKELEKDGSGGGGGGLVFGVPLAQCVENDRLSRIASGAQIRTKGEEPSQMKRHGSRASFSSLVDTPIRGGDESGSCESLAGRPVTLVGSVPGLLDAICCDSEGDLLAEDTPGGSVPRILTECMRHLEQHGLHTLGIFRVSTSKKRIRQLREDFDCGKETTLDDTQCPHDVATLLKEYLRDLPDPLLCRDLYQAFVQTQRIRNRRLQFEALQHLVQLLPPGNRDTLHALLCFLSLVAKHSSDFKNALGEEITGNKMDTNNLATVFAPNILHCVKPGAKDTQDRPEDRIDIINVVRTLIDHYRQLFIVPAELLDEVYIHMMDTHPEVLDNLLNNKDAIAGAADESLDELDSESNSAPWTPTMPTSEVSMESAFDTSKIPSEPKKTYSREEFLHESAATGGPNIGMRIRHKDRIRERSSRRRKEKNDDGSITSSAIGIISRLRGQKEDDYQYSKTRSSSIESTSSTHTDDFERRKSSPYVLNNSGVITASLTIPVQTSYNVDDDIPYIEDGEKQQLTIGLVRAPTAPPRRRNHSVGSDSSAASVAQPVTGSISLVQGYDSAVGSSTTASTAVQNTPTSVSGDAGVYSSPTSWTSSPPTSPDSVQMTSDDLQSPKSISRLATRGTVQKVSFSSTQELQQVKPAKDSPKPFKRELSYHKDSQKAALDISKSSSSSAFPFDGKMVEREPKFTQSISSIGNAVLKSKTAEFERISRSDPKGKSIQAAPASVPSAASAERDKKKYTKRRYTDSRHPTRHIPDSESLESASSQRREEKASAQAGPVYKRRELISSVPSK